MTDIVLLLASLNPDVRAVSLVTEGTKFPKNLKLTKKEVRNKTERKLFDKYFQSDLNTNFTKLIEAEISSFKSNFKQIKKNNLQQILEVLWYSYLPCVDVKGITSDKNGEKSVLKQCKWKGVEVPCSKIFKKFPTDHGFCCSFNMIAANKIFYEGQYTRVIEKLQKFDENNAMDFDGTQSKY